MGRAGSWSEQLLRYLWYVTWQHGEALPAEVEALWTTAAGNTRNIVPVLDYLITKCTQGEEAASEARARSPLWVSEKWQCRDRFYLGALLKDITYSTLKSAPLSKLPPVL